jgi:hypothetical protein
MNTHLKIGNAQYSISAMRSKTQEEAVEEVKNNPIINSENVKKAWKACNGFSVPNHLKDQLIGIKPNKEQKRSEKKKDTKKSK